MEDDSGERIILSCILEIPEIKRNILKYFHRNRLEDIQAVLSLWTTGLLREEDVKEHFEHTRGTDAGLASSIKIQHESNYAIEDRLGSPCLGIELDRLTEVVPKRTRKFIRRGLQCRREMYTLMVESDTLTSEDAGICLVRAAEAGIIGAVAALLDSNRALRNRAWCKEAFIHASRNGDTELVDMLFRGCEIDADAVDGDGMSALMHAALNGDEEMVRLLIDQCNAKVDAVGRYERTALMHAAENGKIDMLNVLIDRYYASVDFADEQGMTALLHSLRNWETVEMLIGACNANVEAANIYGFTPLILSAGCGYFKTVELLISCYQANVDATDNHGMTALMHACDSVTCCDSDRNKTIEILLERSDANVDIYDDQGKTALMYAAENGYTEIVERLINQYKVDVHRTDDQGMNALMYASKYGHSGLVKLLIETHDVDVNAPDEYGRTVLMFAAANGDFETAEMLISHFDANVEAKNNEGKTPLMFASENGDLKMVKMLTSNFNAGAKTVDSEGINVHQ